MRSVYKRLISSCMRSSARKDQSRSLALISIGILSCFSYICLNYGGDRWERSLQIFHRENKAVQVQSSQEVNLLRAEATKRILLWTPYFGGSKLEDYGLVDGVGSQESICRYQCEFTTNRSLLSSSNAVLFHGREIGVTDHGTMRPADVPTIRIQGQPWIVFLFESPANSGAPFEAFSNFFNLTMTYRKDSNIYTPYGYMLTRSIRERDGEILSLESLKAKTQLVAWISSNCETESKRELLVAELQKHVSVDIYGDCGSHWCPDKDTSQKSCYKQIGESYKFYLSLENSLCRDYVTEKFFNALGAGMVPIVYGGADYTIHAREGSYIDVNSFQTVKDLANHVMMLDKNDTEYSKYFAWRTQFRVDSISYLSRAWCNLCEKLTSGDIPANNVIENLKEWWFHGEQNSSACSSPSLPTIIVKDDGSNLS